MRERLKKRRGQQRRAVQRLRDQPYASSTATVGTWLNALGNDLGQYAAVFDTQAVDGATLMALTETHLKEELKVRYNKTPPLPSPLIESDLSLVLT